MSRAAIDKSLVLKVCENFFNKRKAGIEEAQEVLIEKAMNGGWCTTKILTREQAIDGLESGDHPMCADWNRICSWGESDFNEAENLYALALRTEDKVFVDTDMMWLFKNYSENK